MKYSVLLIPSDLLQSVTIPSYRIWHEVEKAYNRKVKFPLLSNRASSRIIEKLIPDIAMHDGCSLSQDIFEVDKFITKALLLLLHPSALICLRELLISWTACEIDMLPVACLQRSIIGREACASSRLTMNAGTQKQ